ncbi:MAG: Na(+)/H(+) antiporter subunit D [Planctomycetota bacterium]
MPESHPAIILMVGALVVALLRGTPQKVVLVALPIISFINLLHFAPDTNWIAVVPGLASLHWLRVDSLALVFGYLFHLAALVAVIYSLHHNDRTQHVTGLLYAASAIGLVFAGDLITVFIFWELLAITSVFQVWANKDNPRARGAGLRYLLMHVSSGLLMLAGAALHWRAGFGLEFTSMVDPATHAPVSAGAWLILIAIGIKCGFPLLHNWLIDAYPESTPSGTLFLCCFTTKAAVYALARGFEGTEALILIGTIMTAFPIFYAVIENDLRRVLSYSMINQIGFMVVGVGVGGALGVNGAVAHAFNDVFFKGLLFMSMGAVMLRTGTCKGTDLGCMYKSMPWTTGLCLVGAASISAVPLFSGFISKALIVQAVIDYAANVPAYAWVWIVLMFASAGVVEHAGIKIPFFGFFGHDSGRRVKEAPLNMRVAMAIAAAVCIFNGCYPTFLYSLLPYTMDYWPYDVAHVIGQFQLLCFASLAVFVLMYTKIYPPEVRSVNLDSDIVTRKAIPLVWRSAFLPFFGLLKSLRDRAAGVPRWCWLEINSRTGIGGLLQSWQVSGTVVVIALILLVFLLLDFARAL